MYNPLTYNKQRPSESISTTKNPSWTFLIVFVFSMLGLLRVAARTAARAEKESVQIAEKQPGGRLQTFEALMQEGLLKPKEKTPAE